MGNYARLVEYDLIIPSLALQHEGLLRKDTTTRSFFSLFQHKHTHIHSPTARFTLCCHKHTDKIPASHGVCLLLLLLGPAQVQRPFLILLVRNSPIESKRPEANAGSDVPRLSCQWMKVRERKRWNEVQGKGQSNWEVTRDVNDNSWSVCMCVCIYVLSLISLAEDGTARCIARNVGCFSYKVFATITTPNGCVSNGKLCCFPFSTALRQSRGEYEPIPGSDSRTLPELISFQCWWRWWWCGTGSFSPWNLLRLRWAGWDGEKSCSSFPRKRWTQDTRCVFKKKKIF